MKSLKRKVGIIGVGHVGAHCAFTLAVQGVADEIVLVDIDPKKVAAEHQDLFDAIGFMPGRVRIATGNYSDLGDCDVVVISVGMFTETSDRLDELYTSAEQVESLMKPLMNSGFDGILINITNPCDIIARLVWELSGLPAHRVFGTGTMLDSARFRAVLSQETGLGPDSIQGVTIGEHGDSQLAVWSHVVAGGQSLDDWMVSNAHSLHREQVMEKVRKAAWIAYEGKGATEYAIACALSRLVKAIFNDERGVFPVSVKIDGLYGQSEDIFISTPCVLGADGIVRRVELALSEDELCQMKDSCHLMSQYHDKLNLAQCE